MKMYKRILLTAILTIIFTITGCGQTAGEGVEARQAPVAQKKEIEDAAPSSEEDIEDEFLFRFVVQEAYEVSIDGSVVTGVVYSGTMRAGDTAFLVKGDGSIFEVTVKEIEINDEEAGMIVKTKEAGEGMPAGVLLEGIESDQIDNADVLVGVEE